MGGRSNPDTDSGHRGLARGHLWGLGVAGAGARLQPSIKFSRGAGAAGYRLAYGLPCWLRGL